MTAALIAPSGVDAQPLADIVWVPYGKLSANDWNPNRQAPPEYRLLKISLLENGWTQPIVVRTFGDRLEIVDGYHRWLLVGRDPQVADLTEGLVPIVVLPECDPVLARLATVRHNRARGVHHVLGMADIVADLLQRGLSPQELAQRLQMDAEEVSRLADRGNMLKRGAGNGFSKGWAPAAS